MLRFHIKGSATKPYRVTFEGQGLELRAFCTCPGFDRGGHFCKHAAALLNGEWEAVVEGREALAELAALSEGSPLRERAATYKPSRSKVVPVTGFASLTDVHAAMAGKWAEAGYACSLEDGFDGAIFLRIGRPFKGGGIKKAGQLVLSYEPWTLEVVETSEGEWEEISKPSVKFWRVEAVRKKVAYTTLDRALAALGEKLHAK
ncbi:SWIM zinc finger family protein [Ancylobacter sp. SL191]|uniref:SWIM zinc finger family protein n=1 Tax=Ancylobacter sp. SL191 TaxID=2995166 RepID=UPI00226F7DED|nr:SWIM zinc finger family protein [Ancylobacter sp. SL191]WAC26397.1 SWIM zinc finger domain-containing protein [Ancylobacter sp. SL191]